MTRGRQPNTNRNINWVTDEDGNVLGYMKDAKTLVTIAELSLEQSSKPNITGVVAGTENNTASMPDGSTRDLMTMRQKAQSLKNNTVAISCAAGATTNLKRVIGAVGDSISTIEIIVAATPLASPVRLKDGNNTAYDVLPTDAPVGTSVVALNRKSLSGGWQAILPANCTANITGEFQ